MNWIGPALLFYFCVSFLFCWLVGRFLAACRDLHEQLVRDWEEKHR